ncbi:glycosyltransferase involved in cell wall biosynthesis [Parabacteroides sp. PFB2-12]|uniref:glycosyltransferase family 2 protein n=1 Tax=unclassified Parabacteroides TaxID=2649774 RepID=UPI002474AEE2|nr:MULTISPECIES: glycosyltransferase [unclassified Parabacteroides]MDH6343381.1 glycosyltransferase involved in cell wall biosynthesis [Parabacteroides sp. PM6-13]MDH6390397.1 glycosyltransferase involved in cell wall biosynthesis [Parabacteroides sp. PFB2-12]
MQLSIIIPVYNVEAYLEECLNSCLEQDIPHADYEIIAINDGSPDGSLAILERYADKYPNITVLSQENKGLSATRNRGIEVAKGEYIWFIDSDDWIERNCLSSTLGFSEDMVMFDGLYGAIGNNISKEIFKEVSLEKPHINFICISPCVYLFKRTFLVDNNLKFIEGLFFEDTEFTPRCFRFAKSFRRLKQTVYYYRSNPDSICRAPEFSKYYHHYLIACEILKNIKKYTTPGDKWDLFFQRSIVDIVSTGMHRCLALPLKEQMRFFKAVKGNKEITQILRKNSKPGQKIKGILLKNAVWALPLYLRLECALVIPLKNRFR